MRHSSLLDNCAFAWVSSKKNPRLISSIRGTPEKGGSHDNKSAHVGGRARQA